LGYKLQTILSLTIINMYAIVPTKVACMDILVVKMLKNMLNVF